MRISAEDVLDLVDVIHAGATCDAARAKSAEALSGAFHGAAVMLFRQADALVEDLEHANWPEESVALCSGRFNDPEQNRLLRTIPTLPLNVPLRPDLAGDGRFESSEVFVHAMRPYGLLHPLGAMLARTRRDVSVVSIMGRTGPFEADDEALLLRLMPALTSADRVRRLLVEAMEARRVLEEALDHVGRPVAVLDEGMRVRYANTEAQGLFEAGDLLRLNAGRMVATSSRADERLRAGVRGAVAGARSEVVALGSGPGMIRVEPLRPGDTGVERPLALLVGGAAAASGPSACAPPTTSRRGRRRWPRCSPRDSGLRKRPRGCSDR